MEINDNLDFKVSARTHPGAAVLDSSMGEGDPSPTRQSSLGGNWLDVESS